MLELRPTCDHRNVALPPESVAARICSFECTFCAACVEQVLGNVCPGCGGGFVQKPVEARTLPPKSRGREQEKGPVIEPYGSDG